MESETVLEQVNEWLRGILETLFVAPTPVAQERKRMHSLYWDDSCEIEITILKATRSALDEYDLGFGSNFITLEQEHVDALKAGKALAWRCADVSTFVVFEDAPLTERTEGGIMEKSYELLEKALEIRRSGDDALMEWCTELTAEEQMELAVQFRDALDDLIPTLQRWSRIIKMSEEL